MDTLLLSAEDIRLMFERIGRDEIMRRVIDRLTLDLRQSYEGARLESPARGGFVREQPVSGVLEWMPHRRAGESATIKLVAYSPANPREYALPTILATLARFDDRTGQVTVLADGLLLTAARTGAASAIASRVLARADSGVVGLVGTGAQAVTQLHALSLVLPVRRVLAWDVERAHLASFAARVAFLGLDVRPATPEEILRRSDVICTATSVGVGAPPVLPAEGWKEGLHINAVGADLVGKTELPRGLLRHALVVPDHREQAVVEGECQQLDPADVGPSLNELCARPEMFDDAVRRLTVFDSTGFALEDHSALDVFVEAAADLGIGTQLALECVPEDPLDPYSGAPVPASLMR